MALDKDKYPHWVIAERKIAAVLKDDKVITAFAAVLDCMPEQDKTAALDALVNMAVAESLMAIKAYDDKLFKGMAMDVYEDVRKEGQV